MPKMPSDYEPRKQREDASALLEKVLTILDGSDCSIPEDLDLLEEAGKSLLQAREQLLTDEESNWKTYKEVVERYLAVLDESLHDATHEPESLGLIRECLRLLSEADELDSSQCDVSTPEWSEAMIKISRASDLLAELGNYPFSQRNLEEVSTPFFDYVRSVTLGNRVSVAILRVLEKSSNRHLKKGMKRSVLHREVVEETKDCFPWKYPDFSVSLMDLTEAQFVTRKRLFFFEITNLGHAASRVEGPLYRVDSSRS